MCALVLHETGLLPHVNAGVMEPADLAMLRRVSVSQGLMLETLSERLSQRGQPHFGSPDKHPAARLRTIEDAGRLAIPFTSGILIGIGETRRERIEALLALRDLHAEACARAAAPPLDDDSRSPFQTKTHTPQAVLCGDFNLEASEPEYSALQRPLAATGAAHSLTDAWQIAHAGRPHEATFRLFDRSYGPEPIACDFFFVSAALAPRVRQVRVDQATRASDHQPVLLELG